MQLSPPLFAAAVALCLVGCIPAQNSEQATVVASIYPLAFVAEQIAGSDASVILVTPAGAEPHEFEPTPGQIAAAASADVLLWNGGGVDAWSERLLADRQAAGQLSVGLLETITNPLREGSEIDPHAWLDPSHLRTFARAVTSSLSAVDPTHASAYAKRAVIFDSALLRLDESFRAGLANCEGRDIIAAHDAFGYLGDRYDLNIHALAGLSPEEEPSPATVAALHDLAATKGVTDIFAESLIDSEAVRALATDIGGQVRVLDPIEGLSAEGAADGEDYLSLMQANLNALRSSLRCR